MFSMRIAFALALVSLTTASPLIRQETPIPGEYIVGFHYPVDNLIPRNVTALIEEVASSATLDRRDGKSLQILDRYNLGDGYYQGFAFKIDSSLWNLDAIDGVTDGTFNFDSSAGAGVDIYIVDSIVDVTHSEFQGRVRLGYPEDGKLTELHGTHVAGIAAGKTHGIARKANIISVELGKTLQDVLGALRWTLQQIQGKGKTTVANFSWGINGNHLPVADSVRALVDADMAIAVSAGNESNGTCERTPQSVPGVLSVAASERNSEFATR
ncbi:peptidase S8/S53 domain-containing protein [Phlyctochytrium arcticum]|nr:peptidase S8/S53 domain-containing protein [Phlyctochytrium arcticum]